MYEKILNYHLCISEAAVPFEAAIPLSVLLGCNLNLANSVLISQLAQIRNAWGERYCKYILIWRRVPCASV
jgi:hypothetical protein